MQYSAIAAYFLAVNLAYSIQNYFITSMGHALLAAQHIRFAKPARCIAAHSQSLA